MQGRLEFDLRKPNTMTHRERAPPVCPPRAGLAAVFHLRSLSWKSCSANVMSFCSNELTVWKAGSGLLPFAHQRQTLITRAGLGSHLQSHADRNSHKFNRGPAKEKPERFKDSTRRSGIHQATARNPLASRAPLSAPERLSPQWSCLAPSPPRPRLLALLCVRRTQRPTRTKAAPVITRHGLW